MVTVYDYPLPYSLFNALYKVCKDSHSIINGLGLDMGNHGQKFAVVLGSLLSFPSLGCSSDEPAASGKTEAEDVKPAAVVPLNLSRVVGCTIDAECASGEFCFQNECAHECSADPDCDNGQTCSSRGQCLTDSDTPSLPEVVTSVTTSSSPETTFAIFPGQKQVTLELKLTGPLPSDWMTYTLTRSDETASSGVLNRASTVAAGNGNVVRIAIPVGKADPALGAEATNVQVLVKTNIGAYRVALTPQFPISAAYGGSVRMDVFGTSGLPLTFEVVTDPPEAALDQATAAWLVLPVGSHLLFSPTDGHAGAPAAVAERLVYDSWLSRWVAVFDYPYSLASGVMATPPNQTNRVLRFEIEPLDATHVVGKLVDRWEGLYDTRTALGVLEPSDLVLTGDIELEQLGAARSIQELPAPLVSTPNTPTVWPLPPIDACSNVDQSFAATPIVVGPDTYSCGTITNGTSFAAATPAEQASCAIAAVKTALTGATTTAALKAFLDENGAKPDGSSFAQFIDNCTRGVNGTCVPSNAVLCSRQLAAYAYRNQPEGATASPALIDAFLSATQEAYLGRQLAAFKTDADTRLTWLKTSDYPAVVTSAVRSLNEQLLKDWESGVLNVHMQVLGGYFDRAGMAVLSQATSDKAAASSRSALLAQVVQEWRAAMNSLAVGAERWNELYDKDADRAAMATAVEGRIRDLYLLAAGLVRFARDAGTGYQATAFGGGFSALMQAQTKLALPFDDLLFMRDAEVVVSSSLDPKSTTNTLLTERATAAKNAVEHAAASVQSVLSDVQAEALNETALRNRLDNEINSIRDELVNLCGLPEGCTANEFRTNNECAVQAKPGLCGFALERGTNDYLALQAGSQNVSQGGRAVLAIVEALNGQAIAQESQRTHASQLDLELRELDAFANDVQSWNQSRLDGLQQLESLASELQDLDDAELKTLTETLAEKATKRAEKVLAMKDALSKWNAMSVAGVESDFGELATIAKVRAGAKLIGVAADYAASKSEALISALPTVVGPAATDTSGPTRLAIKTSSSWTVKVLRAAQAGAESLATTMERTLNREKSLRQVTLDTMAEQAKIDTAITDGELQALDDKRRANRTASERQREALRRVYEVGREQRAAELAYDRDMAELRSRRVRFLQRLQEDAGLELRIDRAKLDVEQRIAEYLGVAQRAELQDARLRDLDAQRGNILQIVGSPAAFFARTNRVAQAENELALAKDAMMDWLVALEYHAVRPFIDQRLQILLARNTYQLEEIARSLVRLQSACGGAMNHASTVLSVRKDLLALTLPLKDADTDATLSPETRFRSLMESGDIPVDKRVRYTGDQSIGDLVRSDRRVLATTFDVSLDHFANLAASCNAKIEGIMVQLVGEVGSARPTATLLYDGTSHVRSCQPKLEDYIDLIGPSRTNFAPVTAFRAAGRSASPVAGINKWPKDAELNVSFAGLPLASEYTILIDPSLGENSKLDFGKLEDVLIRLDYAYSDFFPVGTCE